MKHKMTGVSLFPTVCAVCVVEQLSGCTPEDTLTVHYCARRQAEVVRTLLCSHSADVFPGAVAQALPLCSPLQLCNDITVTPQHGHGRWKAD